LNSTTKQKSKNYVLTELLYSIILPLIGLHKQPFKTNVRISFYFVHYAEEMSMQWDVCLNESTLSAYIDNALSPHNLNGRIDDDMKLSAVGEERTRRNTMPSSMQMNKGLFVKTAAEVRLVPVHSVECKHA
jgi:hypothetical protein